MKPEILEALTGSHQNENGFMQKGEVPWHMTAEEDNPSAISCSMLPDGGKFIVIRSEGGFLSPTSRTHGYVELVYICRGGAAYSVGDELISLSAGELLFIPKGRGHEIRSDSDEDVIVSLIISEDFLRQGLDLPEEADTPLERFIIDCISGQVDYTSYLHFKVADILPIQNLMENMLWTFISRLPGMRKINQNTMTLLFHQLLVYTDRLTYSIENKNIMLPVFSYIEQRYADGTLTELAELLHYDFAWLSREIKRRCGKTYTELAQEKRLSQAAYLLKNTKLKVDAISNEVGYENISYFHRLFYRRFGVSPKKFRDSDMEPVQLSWFFK